VPRFKVELTTHKDEDRHNFCKGCIAGMVKGVADLKYEEISPITRKSFQRFSVHTVNQECR